MKILIIGAGRMGVRHAQGVKSIDAVTEVVVSDISEVALEAARKLINDRRFQYCLTADLLSKFRSFDTCIIAATAVNRIELIQIAEQFSCKDILVEKPLGQSMEQVAELGEYVRSHQLNCAVNLNMRLYDSFIKLKDDLVSKNTLHGPKTITINTGTLGIGANGIHYLDLLFFLLDADVANLVSAEIDQTLIPSGRGSQFGDFGGWAVIKFYSKDIFAGTVFISMSSVSTVFGAWEIVAPNGRIYFNEVEGKRVDTFRKADSQMPINRYFADYLPPVESSFESPFLGDLTAKWIRGLMNNQKLLPGIDESFQVHKLLFDWLGKSKTHSSIFPIT